MVTRYGMSEQLGSVAYDRDPRTFLTGPDLPLPQRDHDYAEQTAAEIDKEVRAIVQRQWIVPSKFFARSVRS